MKKTKRTLLLWGFPRPLKRLLPIIIIVCLVLQSIAATAAFTISGKVVSAAGEPLSGVTIAEKGTQNITVSKSDGAFTLTVSGNKSILQISSVGYAGQEITLKPNQSSLMITLSPVTQTMDDVVVVGYGRQKKESVVGCNYSNHRQSIAEGGWRI